MTAALVIIATLVGVKLWAAITMSAHHGFSRTVAGSDYARDAIDRRSPTYGASAEPTTVAR